MFELIQYHYMTPTHRNIFFNFLKHISMETTSPAHLNMRDDDWKNKTNTLPYILEKTNRFKINGVFNVLFDGSKVVGCSGIYASDFCSKMAIAGTRTWIDKEYRNSAISREWLLPAEKKWAIQNGFGAIAVCFNEYNKNIIELWKRVRLGETRTQRMPKHLFYANMHEVEFPVLIQYTKQWVMYEKIDPYFQFNWDSIKAN
jgi:hypothetical protein